MLLFKLSKTPTSLVRKMEELQPMVKLTANCRPLLSRSTRNAENTIIRAASSLASASTTKLRR